MEERKVNQEEEVIEERGAQIGTWVSLGIVGAVIFSTFILMFAIYLTRV
ncbi:hypothetical protein [Salipaludibacillus keqinensis]|nr:hypothetical protein [Salipaludibacillus keqinensis]